MSTTHLEASSRIDLPYSEYVDRPLFTETLTLLRCVRDHDFDTLSRLCDDDFGIVDVDPSGAPVPIRTRVEWEAWFRGLFGTLSAMQAETDSEVLDYVAVQGDDLGYSVLDFRQTLSVSGLVATFDCIATIVWKLTPDGWREARWHASVISSDVPDGLLPNTSPTAAST